MEAVYRYGHFPKWTLNKTIYSRFFVKVHDGLCRLDYKVVVGEKKLSVGNKKGDGDLV